MIASLNTEDRGNPGVLKAGGQEFARIISRRRRSQQSCLRGDMLPRCTYGEVLGNLGSVDSGGVRCEEVGRVRERYSTTCTTDAAAAS